VQLALADGERQRQLAQKNMRQLNSLFAEWQQAAT
jgi:hypothetical protein